MIQVRLFGETIFLSMGQIPRTLRSLWQPLHQVVLIQNMTHFEGGAGSRKWAGLFMPLIIYLSYFYVSRIFSHNTVAQRDSLGLSVVDSLD